MNYNPHYKNHFKKQTKQQYQSFHRTQKTSAHPEHPVRNFFFSVFCVFFSLAASFLWICPLISHEYLWIGITAASTIVALAILGMIISFKRSHNSFFKYKKLSKFGSHV